MRRVVRVFLAAAIVLGCGTVGFRLILDESFTRYEGAGRTGFGIAERARR